MSMCSQLRTSHYLLLIYLLMSHPGILLSRIPKRIQRSMRMMRQDGPVDYPMDGGDDGDDDDGDSSGDDADDEDEDDEDEEEEEHLAPADSTIVVPTDEPASISLPPEAEVERLLAMTTPSPSPPISLSPPSAGERLARCMAPPAHSSPPPAFIDIVTASLPSPPLPPLPSSLYISPLVDHRDDIPETELPPRKRLCLSTLGSRYEIRARPIRGRGIDYGLVSTVDAEARRHGISEIGYELAELHEHDTHDLYALLEDAQDSRSGNQSGLSTNRVSCIMHNETHIHAHQQAQPTATEVKGNDVLAYTERFQELTLICTKFCANETEKINKYIRGLPKNIYGNDEVFQAK
ncbi:hypothetical protein Tco_0961941 [Tanacetum coccineum]